MYGMPAEMAQSASFDPSMLLLSWYLFASLGFLIVGAIIAGILTLPVFFLVLFGIEQVARLAASVTGAFIPKLILIMFRGLRRSPLRTSLTYLALFVLTLVLCLIYTILTFIGNATSEKEANFKAIVTHKTMIPSQMPPGYYDRFKQLALEGLPPEMRPVNGDKDIMSWSFVFGVTDMVNRKPENGLPMFCMEPSKIMTMMEGLEDLKGDELQMLEKGVAAMEANKQAIVVSKSRLEKMNLKVGQRIKLYGLNYPDMIFELDIVGSVPEGKYEGLGFMNREYLTNLLKQKPADYVMQDKAINLIWVRLPTKEAFETLNELLDPTDPKKPRPFSNPQVKLETISSGLGSFMEGYKDIFYGMKYILSPAMIAIMSLVVANAISIGVRERRTEMAVLKVLGFQPRHVLALVLGEALLVGLMAGGMSTLLMWVLFNSMKLSLGILGVFLVPTQALLYGPLLGAVVSLAGSIGPAMSAKNVKVAQVFAKVA